MNLEQAQDVVAEYGGFLEWANSRLRKIFLGFYPKSLLPYSPQYIEEALNIVAEFYHSIRDKEKVKVLETCMGLTCNSKEDEKSIFQVLEFINDEKWQKLKWRDLMIENIKGFRTEDQNHISSYFKEKSYEEINFENPDYPTANIMYHIFCKFLTYAHKPLFFIFCRKVPESLLPFPKKHLLKALDCCSINDNINLEKYSAGKEILEDYIDDEVAIDELIKNFSNKETRDSIISVLKVYSLGLTNMTNTKRIYHQDMAQRIYNDDPKLAYLIAIGLEQAPSGILASAVYAKVCNEAEKSKNIELCEQLANSLYNSELSKESLKLNLREPNSFIENLRNKIKKSIGEDIIDIVPEIGQEIPWEKIVNHIFRVLDFDRKGTTIDEKDHVKAQSSFEPYGYLIVESPILNQKAKLPIIHRDDFILAARVFDEPNWANHLTQLELLVTYAPKRIFLKGLSGSPRHVLHYVITPYGTLDYYYSMNNDIHMAQPDPKILFGPFEYQGEIQVKINLEPKL